MVTASEAATWLVFRMGGSNEETCRFPRAKVIVLKCMLLPLGPGLRHSCATCASRMIPWHRLLGRCTTPTAKGKATWTVMLGHTPVAERFDK